MKAFFFDIFGTLVDWRSSIIEGSKNLELFNKRISELEEFVIAICMSFISLAKLDADKVSAVSPDWDTGIIKVLFSTTGLRRVEDLFLFMLLVMILINGYGTIMRFFRLIFLIIILIHIWIRNIVFRYGRVQS